MSCPESMRFQNPRPEELRQRDPYFRFGSATKRDFDFAGTGYLRFGDLVTARYLLWGPPPPWGTLWAPPAATRTKSDTDAGCVDAAGAGRRRGSPGGGDSLRHQTGQCSRRTGVAFGLETRRFWAVSSGRGFSKTASWGTSVKPNFEF